MALGSLKAWAYAERVEMGSVSGDNDAQRLEAARWLIARYDTLRASLVSRAAVVLSANALVAAGALVLVSRANGTDLIGGNLTSGVVVVLAAATLTMTALSIIKAAQCLVNLRPWRAAIVDPPERAAFFNGSDSISTFEDFERFGSHFVSVTDERLLQYALVELWQVTNGFYKRYQYIRAAVRLLLVEVATFLCSAVTLLVATYIQSLLR